MSDPDPFKTYLQMLQRSLSTGTATEHTHRPALQDLLEATGEIDDLIPSWPIE